MTKLPLTIAPLFLLVASASLLNSSCNSSGKNSAEASRTERSPQPNADPSQGSGPGINLNCVMEQIQNPKEAFRYSYTKDSSDDVHIAQEAEITPQTIEGRARHAGSDHAVPFQATRSDQDSWRSASANLTAIAGMASTVALVNHGSAMKRESDGTSMNGYATIHYSIDTSRFDSAERGILGPTMGPGGFEKGDAWVTSEGCPVKLALDSEMHKRDGSLEETIHYEESMVRK